MNAAAITELLKQGLLGALLLLACGVVVYLYKGREADRTKSLADLAAVQQAHLATVEALQRARVEDGQKHAEELLDITRASVTAVANSTNAQLAVKESVAEIREGLADNNQFLRNYVGEQQRSLRR